MVKIKVNGKWAGYTGEFEAKSTPVPKVEFTQAQIDAFTALCKVLPIADRKKIWNEINNSGCKMPIVGCELRESLSAQPRKGLRWE